MQNKLYIIQFLTAWGLIARRAPSSKHRTCAFRRARRFTELMDLAKLVKLTEKKTELAELYVGDR